MHKMHNFLEVDFLCDFDTPIFLKVDSFSDFDTFIFLKVDFSDSLIYTENL